MKITKSQLRNLIQETLEEVENTCWAGYGPGAQTGKKTKQGKSGNRVPNCEKISETEKHDADLDDANRDLVRQKKEGLVEMKITKRQLRRIIKEAVLQEQTIQFVHPDVDNATFENKLANYAHTGDIQGALADPDINNEHLDLELDDFRGNMKYIEHPDFDKQRTKEFIEDLEDAWYDDTAKKNQQALASSPNKAELEAIGGGLHMVLDTDLPYITYQPRRKGGKVVAIMIEDDEGPKGFPMGNMSTVLRDDSVRGYGTTLDKIMAVLDGSDAQLRKKRKPVKYTPPMYD